MFRPDHRWSLGPAALTLACAGSPAPPQAESGSSSGHAGSTGAATTSTTSTTTHADTTTTHDAASSSESSSTGAVPDGERLEVRFLGVGGFSLRHRDEHLITAPLYTNPGLLEVQFGDIESDPARIDAWLPDAFVSDVAAILVGHAHYDHLLDVPHVWTKTDGARVLGNTSMRNLMLAAGLPDDALVALDEVRPAWVDSRMCPEANPCTGLAAGNEGAWFEIDARARVRALCSTHPDQLFGVVHFAPGCVDTVPEVLPGKADQWREGATLAYLVDFFDGGAEPVFRVYVQDAPADAPIGQPHPDLLADRRIDLLIVNVGNYEVVTDHPASIITATNPRYVLAGHWEDFFRPQDPPIVPLPFQALPEPFDEAAIAAMAALGDEPQPPVVQDGVEIDARYFRVVPGTDLAFAAGT